MKNQNSNRLQFIRSRALALRVVSFASIASPSMQSAQSASPSVSAHSLASPSLPSLPPVKSAHVWRKGGKGVDVDASETLPLGFTPREVEPFSPLVSRAMLAEVEPIAYAEALPEIGAHNLQHSVNCMLLALPWRA